MTTKQAFEIVYRAAAGYASGNGEFREIHDAIERVKEWVKVAERGCAGRRPSFVTDETSAQPMRDE